ncbi:hypothetical protein OQH60_02610 [Campylobacter sp. MIT 21-1685]|uniref:hypothetical protein n=1 Tax=unclassified Campylobacter TaxID=2593542 RepID=UPI00224A51DC|nr:MULTISPECIES: hypothetical protein [unclassified Campylobacter]MCX2682761.1 hypothetical protein [Campylobacter sp. MIT 21-1684]MCX2751093.1 hypothetical protein [Campylobacter sp. MIT 21-1682]MCX2807242.1 hypothetical protein [Campylobacter sp. MIT 21-1685]
MKQQRDEFEQELDKRKEFLLECQNLKHKTCYNCDEIFDCQTRKNYVDAVYNSMSKGKTEGGFDF